MTKLATLIATMEGFGKPGAIPTLRNNPGDLRHCPHCQHPAPNRPDDIGIIDTIEHGWEDLDFELHLILKQHPYITLHDFVSGQRTTDGTTIPGGYPGWAPSVDYNSPETYAAFLAEGLGLGVGVLLSTALLAQG